MSARKRIAIAFYDGLLRLRTALEPLRSAQRRLKDSVLDENGLLIPENWPTQLYFGEKTVQFDRDEYGSIGEPLHELYKTYADRCKKHINEGDPELAKKLAQYSEEVANALSYFCTDNEQGIRFKSEAAEGEYIVTSQILTPQDLESDEWGEIYEPFEAIFLDRLGCLEDPDNDRIALTCFNPSDPDDTGKLFEVATAAMDMIASELFFDGGPTETLLRMKQICAAEDIIANKKT